MPVERQHRDDSPLAVAFLCWLFGGILAGMGVFALFLEIKVGSLRGIAPLGLTPAQAAANAAERVRVLTIGGGTLAAGLAIVLFGAWLWRWHRRRRERAPA